MADVITSMISCCGCGHFEGGERIHSEQQDVHIGRCSYSSTRTTVAYGKIKGVEILRDCVFYATRRRLEEMRQEQHLLALEEKRILEKVW